MSLNSTPPFVTPAEQPPPQPPRQAFWLFHLFLRPGRFFSYFPTMVTTFSTAYAALIVGVAAAIDRLSGEVAKQEFGVGGRVPEEVMASWTVYWATCLIFGVIGAILYYGVGGWWYRMRLKLSGDAEPDPRLARQVYIYASLIVALPVVVFTVIDSIHYPTPLAAERAAEWWWLASILLMFWSVYASYRGVRTIFGTTRWKAGVWFLMLPCFFYLLAYGFLLFVGVLVGLGLVDVPPDVSHPSTIDRHTFSLRYPGNWWIDEGDEDYDPDAYFSIEPMQNALVTFELPDYSIDPEEATAVHLEFHREMFSGGKVRSFAKWGSYSGVGAEYTGHYAGGRYKVRVFSATTRKRGFVVIEVAETSIQAAVEPGLAQIRRTFRLKD